MCFQIIFIEHGLDLIQQADIKLQISFVHFTQRKTLDYAIDFTQLNPSIGINIDGSKLIKNLSTHQCISNTLISKFVHFQTSGANKHTVDFIVSDACRHDYFYSG